MTDDVAEIMLVDDRPENLLALEVILEPLGQRLVRALSGEDALRKVLKHDFAVILLDVQMPGLNGFETAELLKQRERSRFTPIIFLTAISKDEEYVFRGYEVGAVDYMFKPLQADVLRSKVSVFVDLHTKNQQLNRQNTLLREGEKREMELQHRAALFESETRVAEIVNSAMEAVITFDHDSHITLFNNAAERMFGIDAPDIMGHDIKDLLHPESREKFALKTRRTMPAQHRANGSAQRPTRLEVFKGLHANGGSFPLEASISSVELPTGKLFTVIGRDITERQQGEEALRAQALALANTSEELRVVNEELHGRQRELEKAISARSRFYASMSHELRTPINAILGYSALMLDNVYGPMNEKQVNGIERTHRAAKHLLELVNDILDLSKIEAGKMELQLEPVEFPGVIEDLFVTVRPMADEHGSELAMEHRGAPRTIVSDPRRVRQVMLNLLSNAIKFGQGRPIQVTCATGVDNGIIIEVIDQGVGIAVEDHDKIFDEFVQLEKTTHHGGTGLGLPISKRLSEALGGSLTVTSQPSAGSTFRLELPQHADRITAPRIRRETETKTTAAASN